MMKINVTVSTVEPPALTATRPAWRTLKHGERIKPGDQYQDPDTDRWHPAQCIGLIVGIPGRTEYRYRRATT